MNGQRTENRPLSQQTPCMHRTKLNKIDRFYDANRVNSSNFNAMNTKFSEKFHRPFRMFLTLVTCFLRVTVSLLWKSSCIKDTSSNLSHLPNLSCLILSCLPPFSKCWEWILHEKPQASILLEVDLSVCPESSNYYLLFSEVSRNCSTLWPAQQRNRDSQETCYQYISYTCVNGWSNFSENLLIVALNCSSLHDLHHQIYQFTLILYRVGCPLWCWRC